jgi:hypothetical protein
MAHFAKVENGIVTQVIVIDQETLNTGHWGDPASWIQTSYNTHGGVHSQGGTPLRKNYAGIGMIYDSQRDAFYPTSPYASWVLDEESCTWKAPIDLPEDANTGTPPKKYNWRESDTSWVYEPPYPDDNKTYRWDLETGSWIEIDTSQNQG